MKKLVKIYWLVFAVILLSETELPAQTEFQIVHEDNRIVIVEKSNNGKNATAEGVRSFPLITRNLEFEMHPLIRQHIDFYQEDGREEFRSAFVRSGKFQTLVARTFREEGIPVSLMWISQVRSGWGKDAERGLWELEEKFAEKYGLKRTEFLDERRSFEKATRFVGRHLKVLSEKYEADWKLVLAAYFCGEETVDRTLAKSELKDFESIYVNLPAEERNLIPKVLAAIMIGSEPAKYGFGDVEKEEGLNYDRVRVRASTSLAILAEISDTTLDEMRRLNPELLTDHTLPEYYIVRVPYEKGDKIVQILTNSPGYKSDDPHFCFSFR